MTLLSGVDNHPRRLGGHLLHLDSLRGIAAMMVALCHSLNMFLWIPHAGYLEMLTGRSPVILFFLLSGFVLCRSLIRSDSFSLSALTAFYLRRFFRLYPAVLGALVFGAFAAMLYTLPSASGPATPLLHKLFLDAKTVTGAAGYLKQALLAEISLDRPLWSIRTEFVGSLVLPLFVWILMKKPRLAMPLGLVLALFFSPSESHLYLILFPFYLGCLICLAESRLRELSTKGTKWLLFLGTILWLSYLRGGFHDLSTGSIILGGLMAVLVPCHWERLRYFLHARPLVFLGRISFSFYLLHRPVSMLVWSALERYLPGMLSHSSPLLPAGLVFLATISMTIPLSALMEYMVERPFNAVGHGLSKRLLKDA